MSSFRRAIFLCFLWNALACGVMVFFLRPGLDPSLDVMDRLRYISGHAAGWRLSWLAWIGAALSLIYFFIHWGLFLEEGGRRGLIFFGVLVGGLGMIPDTLAETLYLGLMPRLAGEILEAPEGLRAPLLQQFIHWQWAITLMTGFLGNGFYALGGLVLNGISQGSRLFPKKLPALGWPVWIFALGLSVASVGMGATPLLFFTAATLGWFLFWLLALLFFLKEDR